MWDLHGHPWALWGLAGHVQVQSNHVQIPLGLAHDQPIRCFPRNWETSIVRSMGYPEWVQLQFQLQPIQIPLWAMNGQSGLAHSNPAGSLPGFPSYPLSGQYGIQSSV